MYKALFPILIEAPDLDRYPLFADAKYTETVLEAGEVLFIPEGVWHYCRSLSPSYSINFWW